MKKDELVGALATAKSRAEEWEKSDITRREALSVMLDAPFKKRGSYDYIDERITYSWPQIYFEIGKLTAARTFLDFEGNVSELECRVEDIQRGFEKHFKDKEAHFDK